MKQRTHDLIIGLRLLVRANKEKRPSRISRRIELAHFLRLQRQLAGRKSISEILSALAPMGSDVSLPAHRMKWC
jgi:hypothetical protein